VGFPFGKKWDYPEYSREGKSVFRPEGGKTVARRLTAEEKETILAAYRKLGSYSAAARECHVVPNTVRTLVLREQTLPEEGAGEAALKHLETRKDRICRLIDLYLDGLGDPEKIAAAPINQLASALGTVLDKLAKTGETGDGKKSVSLTLRDVPEEWLR